VQQTTQNAGVTFAAQNKAGLNPVVALSFTELLEGLLGSAQSYWLKPQFVSYGDAELFTRRDDRPQY
jgi:hypothetical protein